VGALGFAGCGEEFTACGNCPRGGQAENAGAGGDAGTAGAEAGGADTAGSSPSLGGAASSLGDAGSGGIANADSADDPDAAGSAGTSGASEPCDLSRSPSENPCIVSNAYAVFVAPSGSDSAQGTREKPLKSIAAAVALAGAARAGKVVIACSATYYEALSLRTGVRLYGGFGCPETDAPWSYHGSPLTRVAPSAPGPALSVRGVANDVVIEDFEFRARDASEIAASSIAAVVVDSTSVVLRRSSIVAGKGGRGADGSNGSQGHDGVVALEAQRGVNAECNDRYVRHLVLGGRWPDASDCGALGGNGGDAQKNAPGTRATGGLPMTHVVPPGLDNAGSFPVPGDSNLAAGYGLSGAVGDSGLAGIASPQDGSFDDAGYAPAPPGGAGSDGFPGQGGGGGGASSAEGLGWCVGASGGAGGMGGCGGKAGTGGASGGASVGLLSWDSDVTLEHCELVANDGGDGGAGGNGGAGGRGQAGASGGAALKEASSDVVKVGSGGPGGPGGNGGIGGPGAGGNGGPSYALVYSGIAPVNAKSVLDAGKGGKGGLGGSADTLQGAAGAIGLSAQSFHHFK